MWDGKVFAAVDAPADADAADADAAETDWKHKVTPERGNLMNTLITRLQSDTLQQISTYRNSGNEQ